MQLTKKEKDETLNPQVDKERYPLAGEIPRHTSSSSQDSARLSRPQQEVAVMRFSCSDARLNSASASMVATRGSEDVSV